MKIKEIEIGDIVSINTHPYQENITKILISGEPSQTPPLMVVIGISNNEKMDCTCLWYSAKQQKFEKNVLPNSHLKLIKKQNSCIYLENLEAGALLTLSTLDYELAKRKSSFHLEDNADSTNGGVNTINALLSFLPPIMTYIGENKKGEIKCRWFNSLLDRFSETVIPLHALNVINEVSPEVIDEIQKAISANIFVAVVDEDETAIILPRSISYRSGYYFLRGYDHIRNRLIDVNIFKAKIDFKDDIVESVAPSFNFNANAECATREFIQEEILSLIRQAGDEGKYIRFKYKNINDEVRWRTLKEYTIVPEGQIENNKYYVQGYCTIRKAIRTFSIERIRSLQCLNVVYQK